ncbi:heme ABC transporter ATP-binding protein [Marinicellulosiphila megalodicopiae]|uniref:heme ABC transporter ATP-binding protein n=1 Tax=Marinicellulosiphila megalodicopiae TaxID=2724896 RepID=UPI003BB1C0D2
MLKLNQVSFKIGKRIIFNDVSFEVKPGELVCLLGANGAGKSTLLKSICDDVTFSGDILLNDVNLKNFNLASLAKIRSVMPQKVNLNFAFSCYEVVSMGRSAHNQILDDTDKRIIKKCMLLCGVWSFCERRYPYLSGGEQQRVQLARVLAQIYLDGGDSQSQPRLLLLDECTSSLDPKFQHQVYRILKSLKNQNIAILSVVHDINLASQYADRILLLSDGQLIEDASPSYAINTQSMLQTYDLHTQVIKHQCVDRPVVIALEQ